ncbi:MAG: RluA family pseudouridine synthase [Caldilineaceae bacterium]|nr:RluA family pseudouridine synthase [Caldilineaceae bacterium]
MDAQPLSFRTEVGDAGHRLDQVCASRLATLSRTRVKRLIQEDSVLVDGRPATPSFRVNPGQTVTVEVPAPLAETIEPWSVNLSIVFEDEHLAVVDKPPGLSMHPGPGHPNRTLVNALVHRWPDWHTLGPDNRLGLVHRLDMDTSGLVVVARTAAAQVRLQRQFSERTVTKAYMALVDGWLEPSSGTVDVPLGRHPRWRQRQAAFPAGSAVGGIRIRDARTDFKVSRYLVSRPPGLQHPFSLTGLRLHTGRTHQIRVHMAWLGFPVVGDRVYGLRKPRLHLTRQFLHASRLSFDHPCTGKHLTFRSDLPGDLAGLLAGLDPAD